MTASKHGAAALSCRMCTITIMACTVTCLSIQVLPDLACLQLSMEEKAAVDSIIREVTAIGFQDRYALIIGDGSVWQKVYNGGTGFRKTFPLGIIKSCISKKRPKETESSNRRR